MQAVPADRSMAMPGESCCLLDLQEYASMNIEVFFGSSAKHAEGGFPDACSLY